MALAPFHCAFGDSPEVELPCATEVDISPGDDSVDSNRVRIVGTGTIESLGIGCGGALGEIDEPATITKRIAFVPDAPGITLHHNPPVLSLLGGVDRTITAEAYGYYASDPDGNWQEESFTRADITPDTLKRGGLVSIVTYSASGPITIPPKATRAWVRMWGATGASGVAQSDGSGGTWCSGGVGSGGYLEQFLTGLTPANTLTFTRGAAGVAGAGPGGNGGDTILASGTQTIATLTAGGSHGTGFGGPAVLGSIGGTASGGDINQPGQSGGFSNPGIAGIGGVTGLSRGPDGSSSITIGNAGSPGGMIIAWYNDALS